MIAILFQPTVGGANGPYELLKLGREEDAGKEAAAEPPHWRFFKVLDAYCIKTDTPENIRLQYLYFVAKVVSRSPAFEGYDPAYFYFITRELLQGHKRYLDFVRRLYEMSLCQRRVRSAIAQGANPKEALAYLPQAKERLRDSGRCQKKVEGDLIQLLKKSEPLDNFQMQDIIRLTERTDL